MCCRSAERGAEAVAAVKAKTGNDRVSLAVVDVSSLESIKAFASDLVARGARVRCLVNNAGVLLAERGASADGYDLSFATNTLGGLALAQRLLPALERAAGDARVVFVSSGGMYMGAPLLDSRTGQGPGAAAPLWAAAAAVRARAATPVNTLLCHCTNTAHSHHRKPENRPPAQPSSSAAATGRLSPPTATAAAPRRRSTARRRTRQTSAARSRRPRPWRAAGRRAASAWSACTPAGRRPRASRSRCRRSTSAWRARCGRRRRAPTRSCGSRSRCD